MAILTARTRLEQNNIKQGRMRRAFPLYTRALNAAGSLSGSTFVSCNEIICKSRREVNQHRFMKSSSRRRSFSSVTETDLNMVRVTRTSKGMNDSTLPYNLQKEELTYFVDDLLLRTRILMDNDKGYDAFVDDNSRSTKSNINSDTSSKGRSAHHVIAFSGGIDSSVAATLIHRVAFSTKPSLSSSVYDREDVTAVLGLSPAVPMDQRKLAEEVASMIGVAFEQVSTTEGTDEVYVANDGRACLACKTHLYDNLKSISEQYCVSEPKEAQTRRNVDTILYNGTNADDLKDPTRLGLIAANDFAVRSPLSGLSKEHVRAVGRHLGLPNWNHAASPCLRSRLAVGVTATSDRLKNVEIAEAFVKDELGKDQPNTTWDVRRSLRVRILSKNRAMIEVDDDQNLRNIERRLQSTTWKAYFEERLGFAGVGVRKFKTGSVAPPPPPDRIATIASPTGPRKLRRRP